MNKEITIIELLNNIAKGKIEIGTKFNWHYRFNDVKLIYMERCGAIGLYFEDGINDVTSEIRYTGLFERYNYQILNDKVEILEEDKSIIEKIEVKEDIVCGKYIENENIAKCYIKTHDKIIIDKLNEIIEFLNRKEDK